MDAFIHDFKTLEYFFEKIDKASFSVSLPQMVAEGVIVIGGKEAEELQTRAKEIIASKPTISKEDMDQRRFAITDSLDDLNSFETASLRSSANGLPRDLQSLAITGEYLAIVFSLYSQLAEFYLLANGYWIGGGKQLARLLHKANPEIADKFAQDFAAPYEYNKIHNLVLDVLKLHGGLLWDGFRSDAPKEWRNKYG